MDASENASQRPFSTYLTIYNWQRGPLRLERILSSQCARLQLHAVRGELNLCTLTTAPSKGCKPKLTDLPVNAYPFYPGKH